MRDAIVREVDSITDCSSVTAAHLANIKPRLVLNDKGITALLPDDFEGLVGLKSLWLHDNQLTNLPDGVFNGLANLRRLGLSNNGLTTFQGSLVTGLNKLESLWLHGNDLARLSADAFSGLTSLRRLNLSGNDLTALPAGIFGELTRLEQLWIRGNELRNLPPTVFDGLHSLRDLDIANNDLVALPSGIFGDLPNLRHLWLNANRISTRPADVFAQLPKLQMLDLSNGNALATFTNPPPLFVPPQPRAPVSPGAGSDDNAPAPSGPSGAVDAGDRAHPDSVQCSGFDPVTTVLTAERLSHGAEVTIDHPSRSGVCWARTVFRQWREPRAGAVCTVTMTPFTHESGDLSVRRSVDGDCSWIVIEGIISPEGHGHEDSSSGGVRGAVAAPTTPTSGSHRVTAETVGYDPFRLTMFWSAQTLSWNYTARNASGGTSRVDAEGYNPLSAGRLSFIVPSLTGNWQVRWRDRRSGNVTPYTYSGGVYGYSAYTYDMMWSPGLTIRFTLPPPAIFTNISINLGEVALTVLNHVVGWYSGGNRCHQYAYPSRVWDTYFDILLFGVNFSVLSLDYDQNCWRKGGKHDGWPSGLTDSRDDPPFDTARYRWGWWQSDSD